jgi:hypothetical protein
MPRPSTIDSATDVARVCDQIRAEYLEMPGLCLTTAQVQRRWSLNAVLSQAALSRLVDAGVLRNTRRGYALAPD